MTGEDGVRRRGNVTPRCVATLWVVVLVGSLAAPSRGDGGCPEKDEGECKGGICLAPEMSGWIYMSEPERYPICFRAGSREDLRRDLELRRIDDTQAPRASEVRDDRRAWMFYPAEVLKDREPNEYRRWPYPKPAEIEDGYYQVFASLPQAPAAPPQPVAKRFYLQSGHSERVTSLPGESRTGLTEEASKPHLRRVLRATVDLRGKGRGVIVNAAGHVATAAHVVAAEDDPLPPRVPVTFQPRTLRGPERDEENRTFEYEPYGEPFPEHDEYEFRLLLLRPSGPIPFAEEPGKEFWVPLAAPARTDQGSCLALTVEPVLELPRSSNEKAKRKLAIAGPLGLTLKNRWAHPPLTAESEVKVTKDCFPEPPSEFYDYSLTYQCGPCVGGWSGSPVADYAGVLWGIHVDAGRGQWAFSIASQYDRLARREAARSGGGGSLKTSREESQQ